MSTARYRKNPMITVRPVSVDDHAEIQKVQAAATATLRQVYRPGKRAIENKARISSSLRGLVAVADGRIVGTVQYYVNSRSLRAIGLGVLPDYRQKGVARSLIRCLEKIGIEEKAAQLKLHTVKETGNVEIFRRLGFMVTAEQEENLFESDRFDKLTDVEMVMQFPSLERRKQKAEDNGEVKIPLIDKGF